MKIIKQVLKKLGKDPNDYEGINFIALIEQEERALEIAAEILKIGYVKSKDDFEINYMANLAQEPKEKDEEYQQRLTKLNEARLIPSSNKSNGKRIIFCIDPAEIELDKYCNWEYGIMSLTTFKDIAGLNSSSSLVFDEDEDMPIFIKKIFKYCQESKATDIDITTMQSSLSVKLKASGEWEEPIGTFPIAYKNRFMTSLSSLAKVDYISGKELKFRISEELDGIKVLFRVGVMPTTFGENISIRRLPTVGSLPEMEKLGISEDGVVFLKKLVELIKSPKKGGLVLITGETGSGKSTLLSAQISEYLALNRKVNTSEDPVENKHPHPFLNQTEVGEETGLTHMDALAGFLRQNSDVIVIGECRKKEEFLSVVNAALSGHFTYTTYHTGSVEDTLVRLSAMGVDLNLIAGALKAIVSTNLIPKLCEECKIKTENGFIRQEKGSCNNCKGRGIKGVVPILEAAPFNNEKIKNMFGTSSFSEIMKVLKEQEGYISMASQIERLKRIGIIDWRTADAI